MSSRCAYPDAQHRSERFAEPEDLIDDCIAQVEGEASKRDIAIVNMASSGVPAVMADVTRIRQVFLNLLSNAVKYNRDGGGVELSAMTVDGMVRFSVSDTGVGIPLDKHKLVFEPFNRLGAEATKVDGTGIGLTITRQIVEMMHGEIGFHSEPGEGSTFWFSIPAASAMDMGFDPDEATNVELAALDDALKEERRHPHVAVRRRQSGQHDVDGKNHRSRVSSQVDLGN